MFLGKIELLRIFHNDEQLGKWGKSSKYIKYYLNFKSSTFLLHFYCWKETEALICVPRDNTFTSDSHLLARSQGLLEKEAEVSKFTAR